MKKTRLQNISDVIFQSLSKMQEVQEEQIYILFDGIIDLLQESDKAKISDESRKLFRWIQDMWQYRDFGELSQDASFLIGSIWGAMKIVEEKQKRVTEDADVKVLINKYQDYYWLFAAIAKTPGIKHKNLAKRGAKSPSELSQFISRMESENLLTYSRTGREKYYYLQERGRKVYEGIEKAKRRAEVVDTDWVKQIARYNDSLDKEVESITPLYASAFSKRRNVYKIAVKREMEAVSKTDYCFIVDNNTYDNIYTNAGNILGMHLGGIVSKLQVCNSLYGSMAGLLCDNVLMPSAGNSFTRFCDDASYRLENTEQCVTVEC